MAMARAPPTRMEVSGDPKRSEKRAIGMPRTKLKRVAGARRRTLARVICVRGCGLASGLCQGCASQGPALLREAYRGGAETGA